MPNTPCLVGEAASGYALGSLATPEDRKIVQSIFGAVGTTSELKEILLNAVTGLSGSGPAYVFQFIEALADGGVRAGLPRAVAMELAAQTVKGSAEMVLQSGKHPGLLKDAVTSPGGTTIAGVEALEKG
jgi:pyrroline-5-carboxylate reductase